MNFGHWRDAMNIHAFESPHDSPCNSMHCMSGRVTGQLSICQDSHLCALAQTKCNVASNSQRYSQAGPRFARQSHTTLQHSHMQHPMSIPYCCSGRVISHSIKQSGPYFTTNAMKPTVRRHGSSQLMNSKNLSVTRSATYVAVIP